MSENFAKRDALLKEAFRYREALVSYAFGMLRDWELAQDVVQDAFLVVVNEWEDFKEGSVYAWVRQMVYYKAMHALRGRARDAKIVNEALHQAVCNALHRFMDENAAEKQNLLRRVLRDCMSQLTQTTVDILAGFYAHLKTSDELAAHHGRSGNAIRLTLSRARKELQDCMRRRIQTEAVS